MTQKSLLGQIVFNLTVMAGFTLILIILLLAHQFGSPVHVLRDRGLAALAEDLADRLSVDSDGVPQLDLSSELSRTMEPHGTVSFTISDINKRVLIASEEGRASVLHPFAPHAGGIVEYFQHVNPSHSSSVYGVTVKHSVQGRTFWVQVTKRNPNGSRFIGEITNIILDNVSWVIAPFFLGILCINVFTIRRSLAPLRVASDCASSIEPKSKGTRLPSEGMPSEIIPLIIAVNSALDRLDNMLDFQTQFCADLAHDLLTPLAVLSAHLDTLEDKETAAAIRQDVEEMKEIVTGLLEVAELESSGTPPSDVVNLREICVNVAAMLAPIVIEREKSLAVTGTEKSVEVLGSAITLARAVRNLVENALVYIAEGDTIEVNLDDDATIRVIDNGPGISPEKRDQIFERFSRGNHAGRHGVGLGLSIVLRIVQAHNGTIEVDEAPGGGTVFSIRLPKAVETLLAASNESRPEALERQPID